MSLGLFRFQCTILDLMMSADGEERERAECVYIQLIHGLDECSDEDE